LIVALAGVASLLPAAAGAADYVIHISVDGLRPDVITILGPTNLPNFYRLRTEGAFTDNARTDYHYTETLPNHCTQLTGRSVLGTDGHNWTGNSDPLPGQTLASNKGSYVAGGFDVAHDHGRRTAAYVSKTKFSLFDTSWNATNGAPDLIGEDDGRDKLDLYRYHANTATLVSNLLADLAVQPSHYTFLHLTDPDSVGHSSGWNVTPGSPYCNIIKTMDDRLGAILDFITTNHLMAGRTAIVLTADHGGSGTSHGTPTLPANYTVPFYVWGPGVMANTPLYLLNATNRLNPAAGRPPYTAAVQPIRAGEAANVVLQLLGLPPVPGSTLNAAQDLALALPPPADFRLLAGNRPATLLFTTRPNVCYDVQAREDLRAGAWTNLAPNLPGSGGLVSLTDTASLWLPQRFYRLRPHSLSAPPPADFRAAIRAGVPELAFQSTPNALYDLQGRDDLRTGAWRNLVTNLVGSGTILTQLDLTATQAAQRFYRVRVRY